MSSQPALALLAMDKLPWPDIPNIHWFEAVPWLGPKLEAYFDVAVRSMVQLFVRSLDWRFGSH